MQGYEECEDSSHFVYPCEFFSIFGFGFFWILFDNLLSVMNLLNQQPTHVKFLKFFGTSYGLDVVGICSFHLGAGEMIYGKMQIQKY